MKVIVWFFFVFFFDTAVFDQVSVSKIQELQFMIINKVKNKTMSCMKNFMWHLICKQYIAFTLNEGLDRVYLLVMIGQNLF